MPDQLVPVIDALAGLGPAPYLGLVVLVAVFSQVVAWRLRVPSILLLLLVGFGLGQVIRAEDVLGRDVLFAGVSLIVGVILFEGSLTLQLRELRDVARPVRRLCTVTVAIAWGLGALAAVVVGIDWELALLVGAILVVTGPTVITPILRAVRPTRRVATLLRWESIVVDPIGAILAVLVFQGLVAGGTDGTLSSLAYTLGLCVGTAVVITAVLGYSLDLLIRRHVIPDHLQGVTCLAAAVASQALSDVIQQESGLLTVTLLGLFLGNRRGLELHHVKEFTEHLQVLGVGALFIVLAGRVSPDQLIDVGPQAAMFIVLLVLVVRPASVLLGLIKTEATRAERGLLAAMAPRGIVAAAVTSIFALEFAHVADVARENADPRAAGMDRLAANAESLVPFVFLVIVATVALYGLAVGPLAERLGLAVKQPQGVLFVGAEPWVIETAKRLEDNHIPTLLVAREFRFLSQARRAGLRTVNASILSDYAVRDMDLAGIGHLIATTANDDVNATAAREFAQVLGRVNVFALLHHDVADAGSEAAGRRRAPASHLTARVPFSPAATHEDITGRLREGWRLGQTRLTEAFPRAAFDAEHPGAIVMFALKGEKLEVVTASSRLPDEGISLIAMVPPDAQP